MLETKDILETIQMIRQENLDIRTITMGISLYDCVSDDARRLCDKIYDKITHAAEHLVETGCDIEKKYGVPIVNKRVSVTPISLITGGVDTDGGAYPPAGGGRGRRQLHRRFFRAGTQRHDRE